MPLLAEMAPPVQLQLQWAPTLALPTAVRTKAQPTLSKQQQQPTQLKVQ